MRSWLKPGCSVCGALQTQRQVSTHGVLLCTLCEQAWGAGVTAPQLQGLDSRQAWWGYAGSVRRLLVQAKDLPHGAQGGALLLGMTAAEASVLIPQGAVWTTPPPSWKRRLQHWYLPNFLATQLAEQHQQPFRQLLRRQRHTQNQGELDGAERRANLKNVFVPRRTWQKQTVPQCVVLFDDVSTTGTTMVEAARALRTMGVEEVHALCVAVVP